MQGSPGVGGWTLECKAAQGWVGGTLECKQAQGWVGGTLESRASLCPFQAPLDPLLLRLQRALDLEALLLGLAHHHGATTLNHVLQLGLVRVKALEDGVTRLNQQLRQQAGWRGGGWG